MKLTTGIVFLGMLAGTAWGQNPDVIENTRNTMKAVQQKKAMDSDAALASSQGSAVNTAAPASSHAGRSQGSDQAGSSQDEERGGAQEIAAQAADRGRKSEEARGCQTRARNSISMWSDAGILLSALWSTAACWVRVAVPASAA